MGMDTPNGLSAPGDQPVPPRSTAGREEPLGLSRIVLGPQGLRSGWRLAVWLLIALSADFVLLRLVGFVAQDALPRTATTRLISGEVIGFASVLIATALMALAEHRTFSDYSLPPGQAFRGGFWIGFLWGLVFLTALLGLIHLRHGFDFGSSALHGRELLRDAALWAVGFLLVALFEESAARAYPLFTLTEGIGFWPAAFILSSAFGATHISNRGETWVGAFAAMLIGLFFCFTVRRTGTLWFAIGFHFAWDYAESFIYGVPDSGITITGHLLNPSIHGPVWLTGGTVGPEASGFVFLVIAALFVIFGRAYPDIRFPAPARLEVSQARVSHDVLAVKPE